MMKKIVKALILAVLLYFQLYAIYYHMGDGNRWWVLLLILAYPVYMLDRKFLDYLQDAAFAQEKKFRNLAIAFVLSVLFYIGLFLIFLNSFTLPYITAVIGFFLLLFVLLNVLSCAANSVHWHEQSHKSNMLIYAGYFLIPATVYTAGLLGCYPGMLSYDSVYIWSQVVGDGPYNNLHPILYTMPLRLLYILGLDIFGVMVLQCLLAALIYAYIMYRFNRMGLNHFWCILATVLLTLYPLNLFNTLTFWKDIPFTLGLSLFTMELIRAIRDKDYIRKAFNLVLFSTSLLLILFSRHNGVFIAGATLIIAAVIYLVKKDYKRTVRFTAAAVASIIIYFGALYGSIALLGEKYQEPQDNRLTLTARYALRMQGMVTLYVEKWDTLSDEDKQFIKSYIDIDKLDKHLSRYQGGDIYQYLSITVIYANANMLENDSKGFNTGYIELLKKYPYVMITSYIKTTAVVWSAPETGYTFHATYPDNVARKIVVAGEGYNFTIRDISYLPKVKDIINKIYSHEPRHSWYAVLWRPALFMLGILFFLWQTIKRNGAVAWIVALPALLNSVGYLIINEAQDVRYVYVNYTIFLMMTAYAFMDKAECQNNT